MTVWAIALLVANVWFAASVHKDAKRRSDTGKPLAFVGELGWSLAVLVGSFAAVALYWVLHYSTLRVADETPGRL